MKVGEPFNPYTLHAIRVPLAILERRDLSAGAKLLYGRCALYMGKPRLDGSNRCTASVERLARDMSASTDSIHRWLAELIHAGLIERRRHGNSPAEIVFFDPALLRHHDAANLQHQDRAIPQICNSDAPDLQFPQPQNCNSLNRMKTFSENVQENVFSCDHRNPENLNAELADVLAIARDHCVDGQRQKPDSVTIHAIIALVGSERLPRYMRAALECLSAQRSESWEPFIDLARHLAEKVA